jgi:hypothetical protein
VDGHLIGGSASVREQEQDLEVAAAGVARRECRTDGE